MYAAPPALLNVTCESDNGTYIPTSMLASACPETWTGNAAQYGPVIATTARAMTLDSPQLLKQYSSSTAMNVSVRIRDFYQQTISSECEAKYKARTLKIASLGIFIMLGLC